MPSTHDIGLVSHTAVLNRLVALGFEVLLPWASHLGYDLAYYVVEEHRNFGFFVHREAHLVRVQVKTGRLAKDGYSFIFPTSSGRKVAGKNKRSGYRGMADYFAVYLPDNGNVYMVAVDAAPKDFMTLRFKAYGRGHPGTSKGRYSYEETVRSGFNVFWAEDYQI